MRQLLTAGLIAVLCLGGAATRTLAQDAVKDTAKKTGEATKEGAKKTGETTKEGAKKTTEAAKEGTKTATHATEQGTKTATHATKEGTKTAVNATKEGTKKGTETGKSVAKTTEGAATTAGTGVKNVFTGEVSVMCNDGKKHSGKTNTEACAKYGGVKP